MTKQTTGRDRLGDFAPKFAQLNDDVLFGEIWSREDKLFLRDRSLVTICIFMGKGMVDSSLKYHLTCAKNNGITKSEMAEIITHAAFYAGWPNAWAVFNMAKEVYSDDDTENTHAGLFELGEPNTAFAKYFTGNSYLKPLTNPKDTSVFIANVTFAPGCRNNWHIHKADSKGGQILLCTNGKGWYQEYGKKAQLLKPGDVVSIPANVKHWHGAAYNSWFSHIAVEVPGENTFNEWCEPVSDKEYNYLKEQNHD